MKNDKETAALKSEFESILAAIETFRSTCDNADLKSELDPWLKSLQDIASGGKAIIESIIAIQEKDIDTAWETFATAGKALQTWNTYPTAEGVKEGAEAGSKRIQPFVSKAAATAKNKLTPFSILIIRM